MYIYIYIILITLLQTYIILTADFYISFFTIILQKILNNYHMNFNNEE